MCHGDRYAPHAGLQARRQRGRPWAWLHALWLAACGLLPGAVQAQTYTSASTAYALIDSSTHSKVGYNTTPYKFTAVAGCGTAPPVLDDTLSTAIPLGFSFTFGGTAYTSAYVSSNGRLQFGNTTCGSGTNAIGPPQTYPYRFPDAAMNGVMKIFGVDLDPTNLVDQANYPSSGRKTPCTSSATCYVSVATIGTAPSRQFVVTWKNVPEWVSASNTSGSFDLQIILNEDGSFVFQYGNVVHGGTGTAQIGWQVGMSDYQVLAFGAASEPPPFSAIRFYVPAPVAAYRFEEGAWAPGVAGQVADSSGQSRPGTSLGTAQPATSGKVCRALDIPADTSAGNVNAVMTGVELGNAALSLQGSGTVAFWFRANTAWDRGADAQLLDATTTDREWFFLSRRANGKLSFVVTDSIGATRQVDSPNQNFAAGTWVHVALAWSFNGAAGSNQDNLRLFINGTQVAITSFTSNGTITTRAGFIHIGDNPSGLTDSNGTVNSADGQFDELQVFNYVLSTAQLSTVMTANRSCTALSFDHLEIQHATGSGITCTPTVLTVRACGDAACSSAYTGGLAGTLRSSGTAAVFDNAGNGSGAAFVIPAGQSSINKGLQVTSVGSAVVAVNSVSISATGTHRCNFGSPSCTVSAVDAGLLLSAPHHVAETTQTLTVSAVKRADNSLACVPAFANVSRPVLLRCSYTSPGSGTLPVRVGSTALNGAASAAAACDAGGRSVTLAFNASGTASTTLQYADAGQMTLTGTYTGGAATADTGLVLSGSTSFIAAPDHFTVTGVTAGPIRAGASFSATVTARNAAGNTTSNHGREYWPQQAYIGWVRLQPTGVGAVNGMFSGTGARSFSGGAVTASDLAWTEVGRGDLVVRGSDANGYYGSGMQVFGSSLAAGARWCATEYGSCVLPGGTTATVYYGAPGGWAARSGQTGTVACNNGTFGDPLVGTTKACFYAVSSASSGSVGDFIPAAFSVAAPNACGSFTYAGQPVTATVTALNTAGGTTLNFDGTTGTTPSFAQAVALTDGNALGLGTLTGGSVAASGFSAGVGTASVSYAFTTKATAPQNLLLRAGNGAAGTALVSSVGGTEATLPLRSGRLRLSNAFGSATAPLQLAAVTEYWNGSAWLLNSADSCTSLAGASVALSNPRGATGAASTATSSAGALAMSNGSGTLTLAAPSPAGSSLSLDVALNLGSTTTDQSCQAAHPATTGAALPWLRAQNGSCSAATDRDPAARASFGIFAPETRKTVHVRDIF